VDLNCLFVNTIIYVNLYLFIYFEQCKISKPIVRSYTSYYGIIKCDDFGGGAKTTPSLNIINILQAHCGSFVRAFLFSFLWCL